MQSLTIATLADRDHVTARRRQPARPSRQSSTRLLHALARPRLELHQPFARAPILPHFFHRPLGPATLNCNLYYSENCEDDTYAHRFDGFGGYAQNRYDYLSGETCRAAKTGKWIQSFQCVSVRLRCGSEGGSMANVEGTCSGVPTRLRTGRQSTRSGRARSGPLTSRMSRKVRTWSDGQVSWMAV